MGVVLLSLLVTEQQVFAYRVSANFLKTYGSITAQKMMFFMKDSFSKCDQICRKLRFWSHWLKKFLMENLIFSLVEDKFLSSPSP